MNSHLETPYMASIPASVIPNQSNESPKKRTRATPEQLSILENTFTVNPSPNSRMREQLSRELGMTERSIQIWFQNRRAKVKNVAKKSSILHNTTLRMQYYASTAAAAACQAAVFNHQQQNGIEGEIVDPIKSNPDLYHYYYYYYFNQQQQQQQSLRPKYYHHPYSSPYTSSSVPPPISLKNLPPPPPPPPPASHLEGAKSPTKPKLFKKQLHQQRTRAHTIGPYYPTGDFFDSSAQFTRGTSVDLYSKPQESYTSLLNNTVISPAQLTLSDQQDPLLPYQSTPPSFFDLEEQFTWTNLPFCEDPSTVLITPPLYEGQKISAESLQIGTWKRMTFEPNDLVCHYDKEKELFSWCIQDGVSKFKIDIPQSVVQSIKLNTLDTRPGWARLELELKEDLLSFYMHYQHGWVQCRDFTEDKQATTVLLHQLDGPALALKAELEKLSKESKLDAIIMK